jgi:hypothetical protein
VSGSHGFALGLLRRVLGLGKPLLGLTEPGPEIVHRAFGVLRRGPSLGENSVQLLGTAMPVRYLRLRNAKSSLSAFHPLALSSVSDSLLRRGA